MQYLAPSIAKLVLSLLGQANCQKYENMKNMKELPHVVIDIN
jgi:hypothetical protein